MDRRSAISPSEHSLRSLKDFLFAGFCGTLEVQLKGELQDWKGKKFPMFPFLSSPRESSCMFWLKWRS
jgi:hypothetical protein